jgi:hypothetical protein
VVNDPSFDALLAQLSTKTAPAVAEIARRLRQIVLDDLPEAVEVVRLGDKAACYGLGPKKMSEAHVYIMPQAQYVNLGFYHGVGLPDPAGLLEGTGARLRHVKVRSLEDAEDAALRALVTAARNERRATLGR